jgi:hypothetical protein
MTFTDAAEDPIRAEVERWLRAVLVAPVAIPAAVVKTTFRCVLRRARATRERLAQPARVATSLFALAGRAVPRAATVPTRDPLIADAPPPVDLTMPEEAAASVDATALPIDQYESLAASQVVARLTSLTPAELDVVRRFEAGHRARRTVLGKIDQLLARA